MPRQQSTAVAPSIVEDAATELSVDLVAKLAEPLAEFMLSDYEREDWQDSPLVERLARVAAVLEARAQDIPPPVLDALREASKAGRPVGVA